jgi:hypothetical protein
MTDHEASPIDRDVSSRAVHEVLKQVVSIGDNLEGLEAVDALASMVGDDALYNSLITGSNTFMHEKPHAFRGKVASPEIHALYIGLIVGAHMARRQAGLPEA